MSARLDAALAELAAAIREEVATAARPAELERLLSIPEAASQLGIGRTALYGELQDGRVRSVKVGRRRLIPSSAIAERVGTAPTPHPHNKAGRELNPDRPRDATVTVARAPYPEKRDATAHRPHRRAPTPRNAA